MTKFTQLRKAAQRFHCDDRGLEAVQVVMILACAAMALIAVKTAWEGADGEGGIVRWFTDNIGGIISWAFSKNE